MTILNCPGISEHRNLYACRSLKCTQTCALSNDTSLDPSNVAGLSYQTETMCQTVKNDKNDSKNENRPIKLYWEDVG
jgi:hypothetical protein